MEGGHSKDVANMKQNDGIQVVTNLQVIKLQPSFHPFNLPFQETAVGRIQMAARAPTLPE